MSLSGKAINLQRLKIQQAEHELLILIALQRAELGNTRRFEFVFSKGGGSVWFTADVKGRTHPQEAAGAILTINYFRKGNNYTAIPLRQAQELRRKVLGSK